MNLHHLYYFKLACEHLNISKAAERANISQSSLSAAIKNLEREFGVSLIKRQRTGFVLTPEGREFLSLAESLLEHANMMESVMSDIGKKHKTIRFGIPPMICSIILPKLFFDFEKLYPSLKLSFSEAGGYELLQRLRDKTLDIAIIPMDNASKPDGFKLIKITSFEDVCCVSRLHPLAAEDTVSIKDISRYPLTLFSDSFYHNTKMLSLFSDANEPANILFRTSQLSTMEQLISENIAVGFLFKERALQLPDIKALSLKPKVFTDIALVWNENTHLTEDMRKLIDYFSSFEKVN